MIGTIFITGFSTDLLNSSTALCKLFFYSTYVFSSYYSIILILASIDRLLISSQNVNRRLYSSKRLAYLSISVSTFIWCIFSLHILVKAGLLQVTATISFCYYYISATYFYFNFYSLLVIYIVIFVLMIVLSILSFKNVRHIQPVPRQQRKELRTMTKKDFQLLRSLYAHSITYIVFSAVAVVSVCYNAAIINQPPTALKQVIQLFLQKVGAFLRYTPYCSSFFIFICVSKAFSSRSQTIIIQNMGQRFESSSRRRTQSKSTDKK